MSQGIGKLGPMEQGGPKILEYPKNDLVCGETSLSRIVTFYYIQKRLL